MILIQVLAFWMKERRNQCNHNLHLLQSNISTNFYNYWIYFNRAGTHLHGQSKFTYFHIFVSLLNMYINRCQSRVNFQSSPSNQVCFYYLSVSLKSRFWFFFNCTVDNLESILWLYNKILYNLQFEDVFVLFHFTILALYLNYL